MRKKRGNQWKGKEREIRGSGILMEGEREEEWHLRREERGNE